MLQHARRENAARNGLAIQSARAQDLARLGRWNEASEIWRHVARVDPKDPRVRSNLGLSLAHAGHWVEAIDAYGEALRLGQPEDEVLGGLGLVFCLREQYDVAQASLERAVALNPQNLPARRNLVVAYARGGRIEQATATASKVFESCPEDAVTLSALGTLSKDAGLADDAVGYFRRAIAAAHGRNQDHSNLIWALMHSDTATPGSLLAEARRFDARLRAGRQARLRASLPRDAGPPRQMRVGWVSGDIRTHPVGLFLTPILERLAGGRVQSYVYSNSLEHDALSQRAKSAVAGWREIASSSDDQVADQIRRDAIHVLVDLSGHTARNRLPLFARGVAPVQVTWLGCPGTTGLEAMDFILVPPDPCLLAKGWSSEQPIALSDCYCVRDPAQLAGIGKRSAGRQATKGITFGCLNNFTKASPAATRAWAEILHEVADARLILVATGGNDAQFAADALGRFNQLGVAADRISILGRMPHATYLDTYQDIDIALDPFPFNGGTSALDALCTGTPYISLDGGALHMRMAGNLLRTIGLGEWAAASPEDYVRKAVMLARDKQRLEQVRTNLRDRVAASPLLDVARFARAMEGAFEEMWRVRVSEPLN